MKHLKTILIIIILLTATLTTRAYNDHRNRKVDSLETVLKNNPPEDHKELLKIYGDLAWGYLETNAGKSIYYADKGIAVAEKNKGYYKLMEFYRIKAMHQWGASNYKESERLFKKALDAVEMMKQSKNYDESTIDDAESSTYGGLGNLYNTLGNGAQAIDCYLRALKLFQKHGWKESESIAYANIAELYIDMGNLTRAEMYLDKGEEVARETGDSLMMSNVYDSMAKIHRKRGEFDKAEKKMMFVYKYVFGRPDEETSRSACLLNLADIYLDKGDIDKAEKIIRQHEALIKESGNENAQFDCQRAQLAMMKGEWQKTKELAEKALREDSEAPEILINTSCMLARAYAYLGQPDKAVMMMQKADSLRMVESNYAYQNSLSEQEARFESELKDREIQQLSNARSTFLVLSVSIGLLLAVLIALLLYRHNANKRKHELQMAQVTMETEVRERQMLARDLHDGLGGTLSLLKLKIRDHVTGEALQILDKSISDLRRISHHIMPEELMTHGLEVSLRDFAASVPGAQFHFFGQRNPLHQDMELVLYRCAYELVNNAMKHASASRIDIQLMQDAENITLTVSDNGKGFDTAHQTKGMGLQNIQSRIARYKGRMEIISNPGEGTEINVILPL